MCPQQAERAIRHYFKPGNLTALRELALRRTAQRVDAQMVDYMRAHAIAGPWAAGERVLVGVNEDPNCAGVVRYARRLADRLRAPWTAIHVETSRAQRLSEPERDRIAEGLRLAERLGGETYTIPGRNIADCVLDYARANNFTHIVIAKSRRSRWSEWLRGSVTHQLIRHAGDISVHVIAERGEREAPQQALPRIKLASDHRALDPKAYLDLCRICRGSARHWAHPAAVSGRLQHRARVPDRGAGERRHLWAVAVAVRLPHQRTGL